MSTDAPSFADGSAFAGANGSNAGKKAVHVKVSLLGDRFNKGVVLFESIFALWSSTISGICHVLVMRPTTSTENQIEVIVALGRAIVFVLRSFCTIRCY